VPDAPKRVELVQLDRDHPGFRDAAYRARRDEIARVALSYELGAPVPQVAYTAVERDVWRTASEHLAPLHDRYACREYLEGRRRLPLDSRRIPQLAEVGGWLAPLTGFRLWPVAGLVSPRAFLTFLAKRVFLSTQYVRHQSAPLYTPEPDVIHELVGHAPLLAHDGIAELNRLFGEVAERSPEARAEKLIRLYWYTLEFGLVREGGALKAIGAGLLSSYGELGRMEQEATIRPADLDTIAETPFDPTGYQGVLFVAESSSALVADLTHWLRAF
jgi:phenylalanine-4-hydroxylase